MPGPPAGQPCGHPSRRGPHPRGRPRGPGRMLPAKPVWGWSCDFLSWRTATKPLPQSRRSILLRSRADSERFGELAELLVSNETALLGAELLHARQQFGALLGWNVEAELRALDPDR